MTSLEALWHHSFHRALFESTRYPLRAVLPLLSGQRSKPSRTFLRQLRKELVQLLEQDIQNVHKAYYPKSTLNFPWATYVHAIATSNPFDGFRVLKRAKENNWKELPDHAQQHLYPDYYLRTFHWQTDGWFSERSAKRYDASVQFLFGGIADVMRRMSLPPIAVSLPHDPTPTIVEIACGTGSFLPQIHQAFPQALLYGVDLSPDYIRYARKTITSPNIRLIQRNAESLPFSDHSIDGIICNNLFHELPPAVRRNIAREAHRVLKAGAVLSITDSVQHNDSNIMNESIQHFSRLFHEPFHAHYIRDDLGLLLEECGFDASTSHTHVFSKSIHGIKRTQ